MCLNERLGNKMPSLGSLGYILSNSKLILTCEKDIALTATLFSEVETVEQRGSHLAHYN